MKRSPDLKYNPQPASLEILFLGMQGAFSLPPLKALIDGGFPPRAVIAPPPSGSRITFRPLPASFPAATLASDSNLYSLAAQHDIPVYEVGAMKDKRALGLLQGSDLIITACFPRLLPSAWLAIPRLGCINLHPSMLPAYRGPNPIEDQLAAGESTFGITLHFMDEGADTGDIIMQCELPIPAGATVENLNAQAAAVGATLLLSVLQDPENIPRSPQTSSPDARP